MDNENRPQAGAGQVGSLPALGSIILRLDAFLPYRLSVASNRISQRIAGLYRDEFGLSIPEWRVLAVVAERPGATQAELARATVMDRMTVSRAVTALLRKGFVERRRAGDRRTRELVLSPSGHTLHRRVAPRALDLEQRLLAGFSAEEQSSLMMLLQRLERACDGL